MFKNRLQLSTSNGSFTLLKKKESFINMGRRDEGFYKHFLKVIMCNERSTGRKLECKCMDLITGSKMNSSSTNYQIKTYTRTYIGTTTLL